jgi:hypothetical protein
MAYVVQELIKDSSDVPEVYIISTVYTTPTCIFIRYLLFAGTIRLFDEKVNK